MSSFGAAGTLEIGPPTAPLLQRAFTGDKDYATFPVGLDSGVKEMLDLVCQVQGK